MSSFFHQQVYSGDWFEAWVYEPCPEQTGMLHRLYQHAYSFGDGVFCRSCGGRHRPMYQGVFRTHKEKIGWRKYEWTLERKGEPITVPLT